MNLQSGPQKQQLIFGANSEQGASKERTKEKRGKEAARIAKKTATEAAEGAKGTQAEAEAVVEVEEVEGKLFKVDNTDAIALWAEEEAERAAERSENGQAEGIAEGKPPPNKVSITIVGMGHRGSGIQPTSYTPSGRAQLGNADLEKISGDPFSDPPQYGTAFHFFTEGEGVFPSDKTPEEREARGKAACEALASLVECTKISKLLSTFIQPLQRFAERDGRVHCSLNINTETGRLSARMPNLQNQPALDKDRYRIRDAFTCEEGNRLIVADYSQLELRVMAHLTGCASMIDAFVKGGDFHSRTAMGMYDEVAAAVQAGEVALDKSDIPSGDEVPLLKDVFATERRRAKVLNFSIAYGKTAFGLAKDFKVSKEAAKDIVDRWYQDRPEVREWQKQQRQNANRHGRVNTMMLRR